MPGNSVIVNHSRAAQQDAGQRQRENQQVRDHQGRRGAFEVAAAGDADHAERDHRHEQAQVGRQDFVEGNAAQRQAQHHDRQ
jgi:hypothetical protein